MGSTLFPRLIGSFCFLLQATLRWSGALPLLGFGAHCNVGLHLCTDLTCILAHFGSFAYLIHVSFESPLF